MIELCCCEKVLLDEISTKKIRQNSLALTYAMAMMSSECDRIDWRKVNEAIIKRWSFFGLEYIKNRAWKIMKEKQNNNS